MASKQAGLSHFDSTEGLVQVVADNFDTQFSSQNGHNSTHALAMIITQAHEQKPEQVSDAKPIPSVERLKLHELKADNLQLGEVVVHRYYGQRKPRMPEEYSLKVVPPLAFLARQQVSLHRVTKEDLAFSRRITSEDSCPEYGGHNTQLARESNQEPAAKTAEVYTPVSDMPPAEPDTMKLAMIEAQRLTSLTGRQKVDYFHK